MPRILNARHFVIQFFLLQGSHFPKICAVPLVILLYKKKILNKIKVAAHITIVKTIVV